jgi:hypothetical protein
MPKVAPDGALARVFLAFLATARMYYVNIMPALVSGLIEGLGFSNRDAGLVGSANMYGAASGALAAVFIVKRIRWQPTATALLAGLMLIDLASMLIATLVVSMAAALVPTIALDRAERPPMARATPIAP